MTKNWTILILIITQTVFGQNYCDCDSIKNNRGFIGYCNEYLNLLWKPVDKEQAQFKQYVRYELGKRSSRYNSVWFTKKDKLFQNGKQITSVDSVQPLNGVYTWTNKKNLIIEEFYYKNGFIVKHINRDFRATKKGERIHEIMEWDYSIPLKQHYMMFKKDGTIKYNRFVYCRNINYWFHEDTNELASDKITETKPVPDPKLD